MGKPTGSKRARLQPAMGKGGALTNESPKIAFYGISIACIIISQFLAYITSTKWPGLVSYCSFIAIGLHWLVFIPSAFWQTERFFDLTGSFTYVFLALYS